MIHSENEMIKQKNFCVVFKSPYHQEEQTNDMGRRMNYERQNTTSTEKVEKLSKLLAFALAQHTFC